MNPNQPPKVPAIKTRQESRRKLRGAALLTDYAWLEIARALGMTERELQIVQGVFDNLPQKGIAARLKIKEHTTHTHFNRLFKKLAVTTRTELVLLVMEKLIALTISENGMLPPICRNHHAGNCFRYNPPAQSPKA
jgi:DNA-binding CsgD family transcriptional regulator